MAITKDARLYLMLATQRRSPSFVIQPLNQISSAAPQTFLASLYAPVMLPPSQMGVAFSFRLQTVTVWILQQQVKPTNHIHLSLTLLHLFVLVPPSAVWPSLTLSYLAATPIPAIQIALSSQSDPPLLLALAMKVEPQRPFQDSLDS